MDRTATGRPGLWAHSETMAMALQGCMLARWLTLLWPARPDAKGVVGRTAGRAYASPLRILAGLSPVAR
jgi:hypothetical protein